MGKSEALLPNGLPARWRPWQRRKNTIIYHLVRLLFALALSLPRRLSRALGAAAMYLVYYIAGKDRRRVVQQLKQAMPELRDPNDVAHRMYVHIGKIAGDWPSTHALTAPGNPWLDFPEADQAVLRSAVAEGRGVLAVCPHLGNWELFGQALTRHGFSGLTVAKPTYDPRITKLLTDFRWRGGLECVWRGDPETMQKVRGAFTSGRILGVLIDQDTKVQSVFVPFFGRLASTPVIPATLAREAMAPVVFGYAAMNGLKYTMRIWRVPYVCTDDVAADAKDLTAKLTAMTEAAVRQYPHQWMWLHRRWKTRPVEEHAQS